LTDAERAATILALQAELDRIADQLTEVRGELKRRLTRLQTSQANVWRDGIGAGAGIAFAAPTSGLSLLISFWTITSLLVDLLDVNREGRAIHGLKDQLGSLLRRQTDIETEIEHLTARAP
jgi:hypothetical protein